MPRARAWRRLGAGLALGFGLMLSAGATGTRNSAITAVKAPGAVTIDGNPGDWDLRGGIFMASDVEQKINQQSLWLHLMYDEKFLYILARVTDNTPMNNPIPVSNSEGWRGDAIQFRLYGHTEEQDFVTHITAWKNSKGGMRVYMQYGVEFDEGEVANALGSGAQMAVRRYQGNDGYFQELAVPWNLIRMPGSPPAAGATFQAMAQGSFTPERGETISIPDLLGAESEGDRSEAWRDPEEWGTVTFAEQAPATQVVKLENGRSFKVGIQGGVPMIAWEGFTTQNPPSGLLTAGALTAERRGEINAKIDQLGALTYPERMAAEATLKEWGLEATPILELRLKDPEPEIRLTVRSLLGLEPLGRNPRDVPALDGDGNAMERRQMIQMMMNMHR